MTKTVFSVLLGVACFAYAIELLLEGDDRIVILLLFVLSVNSFYIAAKFFKKSRGEAKEKNDRDT